MAPHLTPPHAPASLLLALVALLAAVQPRAAAATEDPDWAPVERGRSEPVPFAFASRYDGPSPTGALTLELLLGGGAVGGGGGLRASLGAEPGAGWRLEVGLGGWTENGATALAPQLSTALLDAAVARRLGRIEAWAAVGYTKVSAATGADTLAEASGAALTLGVRLALTNHVLVGLTVRQAFVGALRLDGLGTSLEAGRPWIGLTLAWRFGGGP